MHEHSKLFSFFNHRCKQILVVVLKTDTHMLSFMESNQSTYSSCCSHTNLPCSFCHECTSSSLDPCVFVCACKTRPVHPRCLQQWLLMRVQTGKQRFHCEVCGEAYMNQQSMFLILLFFASVQRAILSYLSVFS